MKVTYRLPSNVPYAYVEVTFELADANGRPDFSELAYDYAQALGEFREQEKSAINGVPRAHVPMYDAPEVPKVKPSEIAEREGLGVPVIPTDDEVDKAASLMKTLLGAVEVDGDDPDAPWNKTEEPKPTPSTTDDDWDFDL